MPVKSEKIVFLLLVTPLNINFVEIILENFYH